MKNLMKLNHKLLVKYLAIKYFKETDKHLFVVQVNILNYLNEFCFVHSKIYNYNPFLDI